MIENQKKSLLTRVCEGFDEWAGRHTDEIEKGIKTFIDYIPIVGFFTTKKISRGVINIIYSLSLASGLISSYTGNYAAKRGLEEVTPNEFVRAQIKMFQRVERKNLVKVVGEKYDINHDRELSEAEVGLARENICPSSNKSYAQALTDFTDTELKYLSKEK